jgi:hypothetical protein
MSERSEPTPPEWRIVQVLPADEGNVLSAATARFLNDNSPASRRVLEQLGRAVSRVLRERGVRVAGRRLRSGGKAERGRAEGLSETVPRPC